MRESRRDRPLGEHREAIARGDDDGDIGGRWWFCDAHDLPWTREQAAARCGPPIATSEIARIFVRR